MPFLKKTFVILIFIHFLVPFTKNYALSGEIPDYTIAETRRKYAQNLIEFLKKIDDSLPTLSPSQKEWLEKEFKEYEKTENHLRIYEVTQSKEYNIHFAKENTQDLIEKLNSNILYIQYDNKKLEMYTWLLISINLLEARYWNAIVTLGEMGLIDKKIFFNFDSNNAEMIKLNFTEKMIFLNHGAYRSRHILNDIILPNFP
jgi:hypothetical protein